MMFSVGTASAASITATSAGVSVVDPAPASVAEGALESDVDLFAFLERTATLSSDIEVDIVTDGTYSGANVPNSTISAGTGYSSFFIQADPVGQPSNRISLTGTITFDQDILGIIISNDLLDDTDSILGSPTTTYIPSSGQRNRALESSDSITINGNQLTLNLLRVTGDGVDQLRVLVAEPTATIPEPTGIALFGLGLLAMGGYSMRRKANR